MPAEVNCFDQEVRAGAQEVLALTSFFIFKEPLPHERPYR
jgi:hypothetical protein